MTRQTQTTPRIWDRCSCHVPVSVIEHPTNFAFQGVMYNVCDVGLYLETGYRIGPSQTLILRLCGEAIQGQQCLKEHVFYLGQVLWIRNLVHSLTADYGMGIRLLQCERKENGRQFTCLREAVR